MFRYIKGLVEEIFPDRLILENQGIGYDLMVSSFTASELTLGSTEKIYTKFIVKEDDLQLIGFRNLSELNVFNHLVSVSKVGPKLALAILSAYQPEDIIGMILTGDVLSLSKVSGLGKKTSERIILELKDKFKDLPTTYVSPTINTGEMNLGVEAVQGLMGLGFSKKEAEEAVMRTMDQGATDLETILKKSLVLLQRG